MSGTKTPDSTGRPADRRKLIAVLHADMVGYSRLIGLDDAGTLERLRNLRRILIDPTIDEHGGRIVNAGGDSLLIVFDSIDGAFRCAMKVQQQVVDYDRDQPRDQVIRFRVGINVGDVIPDGTDVHGDVVNVATRLQAECPPGGICVSRPVHDHVRDRLHLAFEELGSLILKNIARPVEAFVVKFDDGTSTQKAANGPAGNDKLAFVGSPDLHETPEERSSSDRPSIAVLPFANLGGDVEQEYFADGVADDIITELSHNRALLVIARSSSFAYRGSTSIDVKRVGRDLGVRYVVEGSVRRHAGRVRINAQLLDAETGNHIWAERYERGLEDVFAVQDEIVEALIKAISPAVANAEMRRVLRKAPEDLGAWEAYQRGMWFMSKGTTSEHIQARLLFKRAAELRADFAAPFIGLALSYHFDVLTYGACWRR